MPVAATKEMDARIVKDRKLTRIVGESVKT